MSISLRGRFARPFAQKLSPSLFLCGLLCGFSLASTAGAQAVVQTRLDKHLSRLDLGVSGAGYFNSTTSGTNYLGQPVTDVPGNTLGALVQIRYTVKPYVGFEFNYGYARFTQKYSTIGGVQANSNEYTAGYVAHFPTEIFGLKPFAGIGLGVITYKPTTFGGQGLKEQARAAYYYTVGVDDMISPHIGVRAQFRQSISLAPDFGQNYLTYKQRTMTTEPAVGVFIRF